MRARLPLGILVAAIAVGGVLVSKWGWPGRGAPETAARRPPIVLLSLDTLRPDHLPLYGYALPTTRVLDAFATEAVAFAETRCQSTGTLQSHLSLITSLYPPQFAITRDDGVNGNQGSTTLRLPDAVLTLAEVLRENGYETVGFGDGPLVSGRYGFDQGFDAFEVKLHGYQGLRYTLPWVEHFLAERSLRPGAAGAPPLFLFLHTYDIHEPYDAPEPFARAFSRRTFAELEESLGYRPTPGALNEHRDGLAAADAEEVRALYDNGILATDDQLAVLFELLARHGLYDDAIIVLLSDHGEEFLEHGRFNHGPTVYEELVRVPLLVRLPGGRSGGRVVEEPVALLDVAPTLLELAGLPVPPAFEGHSLTGLLDDDGAGGGADGANGADRPFFFAAADAALGVDGLQRGRWKLVRNAREGRTELYDLATDPREQRDLAAERESIRERLAGELAEWVAAMEITGRERGWFAVPREPPADAAAEREALESLRALGYVE